MPRCVDLWRISSLTTRVVLEQAANQCYVDETDTGWDFELAVPIASKFANQSLLEVITCRRPNVEELQDNPGIHDPFKQGVARLRKLTGMKAQDIEVIALGDYNQIIATVTGYVELVLGRHKV